ncbi:hypothetical protein GXW83_21465 [Streptacidiphilus sp. PB12-B1b]|uniref:nucleoside-diphosphate kinase n=1 Tax=Streptacidiphilus sp. PB12-B1b TaxID=2705012 RepID=UPI0015F7DC68|nr:nucleoside-diphosphate kinase [Streptacidiphilus sp. PB12-B1b]QMU77880.1 hypothetical protein GXW83_21465 [Streptacidiphilus sp. PB12-B1b]
MAADTAEPFLRPPFTVDPVRRATYPDDIYFRETVQLLERLEPDRIERMVLHSSFLVFKPEAVVGRRIGPALDFLAGHGFEPLGCAPVRIDPRTHRELWRYQLNAAPLAIVRTVDMILDAGPCLFVALRDTHGPERTGTTAAARLSELKGSSRNRAANGGTLRETLGCELLCLNFVHAPDDPSDLVREVGVLFPRQRTAAVLAMLDAEPSPARSRALAEQTRQLYADHPAHPLRPGPQQPPIGAELHARLDELAEADSPVPLWDRIVAAAQLVDRLPSAARGPLIGPPPGARPDHQRPTAQPSGSAR